MYSPSLPLPPCVYKYKCTQCRTPVTLKNNAVEMTSTGRQERTYVVIRGTSGSTDLDDLVCAGGEQVPGGGLVVYVHDVVLAVVEACRRGPAGSHTRGKRWLAGLWQISRTVDAIRHKYQVPS